MISFSHVCDNIVTVYQRDVNTLTVQRKIEIDLNSLKNISFNNPFTDKQIGDVRISWIHRGCYVDEINPKRRKCIECGEKSDTTYCKECWSEKYGYK